METGALVTSKVFESFGEELQEAAERGGLTLQPLLLENDPEATLAPEQRPLVQIAFLSGDLQRHNMRGFFESVAEAPNLRWLQSFGVGVDRAHYGPLLERGVRITNAIGVNSEPIAQHALTGLLMLARRFPYYLEGQRRHEWRPINWDSPEAPPDLSTQTMVIVGLGAVGSRVARFAQVLGLRVVGVRRSPRRVDEPVDAMATPSQLDAVLAGADWLVLACTLTEETRGLIDARRLALLPAGAHLINVSRGEVVQEQALIEALRSGRLGGAYLDVFAREPLAPDAALWDMPNVIISPHNAASSSGKFARECRLFLDNLERWGRGEPLINEVFSI